MKKIFTLIIFSLLVTSYLGASSKDVTVLSSPDKKTTMHLYLSEGRLQYEVKMQDRLVLEKSPLGVVLSNDDLSQKLSVQNKSKVKRGKETYQLNFGKKKNVKTEYSEQIISVKNEKGTTMNIILRVANEGVAFSYQLTGSGQATIVRESTGFKFPSSSTAFISPLAKAKTGWARTNPSYEDHYELDSPVGTPSRDRQGWVFPALFKTSDDVWVLLSETGVDKNYVGSHLADNSADGLYLLEFPHQDHNLLSEPTSATVNLPFTTPWRTINIGQTLAPIVESTMAQDMVKPYYKAKYDYKPGKASWSWLMLNDDQTYYPIQKDFIDMAAKLKLEYCLIDSRWDVQIGRDKIEELAQYASTLNVGILLWYNSNGKWNDAPQTPMNLMIERDVRRKEMAWMQKAGVKGIKVDFFGGDKQPVMKFYQDILEDANDFGLAVNFHGCTLPRGWDRMFPNFVTDEAVMGMEFCKFNQHNADMQPSHCAVLPFTRNVVAPMDFTPLVLRKDMGGVMRRTTPVFELALPIIFYSAIQHFGLTPEDLKHYPNFVWEYISSLSTTWDDTKLLAGYPGKDVVLARQKADKWFVAGINGEKHDKKLSFRLPFVKEVTTAHLIIDDELTADKVIKKDITIYPNRELEISVKSEGGFVLVLQ